MSAPQYHRVTTFDSERDEERAFYSFKNFPITRGDIKTALQKHFEMYGLVSDGHLSFSQGSINVFFLGKPKFRLAMRAISNAYKFDPYIANNGTQGLCGLNALQKVRMHCCGQDLVVFDVSKENRMLDNFKRIISRKQQRKERLDDDEMKLVKTFLKPTSCTTPPDVTPTREDACMLFNYLLEHDVSKLKTCGLHYDLRITTNATKDHISSVVQEFFANYVHKERHHEWCIEMYVDSGLPYISL